MLALSCEAMIGPTSTVVGTRRRCHRDASPSTARARLTGDPASSSLSECSGTSKLVGEMALGFHAIAATGCSLREPDARLSRGTAADRPRVFHRLLGSAPAGGCWSSELRHDHW